MVLSMVGLQVFREGAGREPLANRSSGRDPLMTEQALSDVESAEAAYLASIEKLSLLARPRLEDPNSPQAAGYREKLMLLDSAIAEIRAEADRNRFNTHLRKELLAMYREKQRDPAGSDEGELVMNVRQGSPVRSARARLIAGALLLAAAAPAPPRGREEFTRKFEKSLPLPAGQSISIEHSNGGVSIGRTASRC